MSPETIKVRSSRSAQWADSALGCPKKGEKTTPSITRGSEVRLEAMGREYTVHVGGGRAVVCEAKPADDKMVAAARLNQLARKDLAERLKVGDDAIETSFLRPATWRDGSLGCPQPGMMYPQMVTPGFVIELTSKGKAYTYHADL